MRGSIFKSLAASALLALSSVGAQALEVGEPAPLFEATSTKGAIKLADYREAKHLVLSFYFADFTPV